MKYTQDDVKYAIMLALNFNTKLTEEEAEKEADRIIASTMYGKSDVAEYNLYLLQRFNDYEVPLSMTAEDVRELLIKFEKEYDQKST